MCQGLSDFWKSQTLVSSRSSLEVVFLFLVSVLWARVRHPNALGLSVRVFPRRFEYVILNGLV